MTTTRAVVLVGLAQLAVCLGAAFGEDAAPDVVIEVRVEGNQRMSEGAVLASVKTRTGQRYDEQVVRDDQRRLMATGRFASAVALKTQTDRGVIVAFVVRERQLIGEVAFQGNRFFSDKELQRDLTLRPGDALDEGRVEATRSGLERRYREKGFYFAEVTVDPQGLAERRQVVFRIVEGPRIRVRRIRFVSDEPLSFSGFTLRQKIKTSRSWWFITRGKLEAEQLERDALALREFYRSEGHLDAEVGTELAWSDDRRRVEVRFLIDEGPRYRVNQVRFEGNVVFSDEELLLKLLMTPGEHYTALELRRDVEALQDTYGEIGHLEATVTSRIVFVGPQAAADEPGAPPALVNVVYTISQGQAYRVGRVTIRGNDITQDRVIRRMLRLYPGQLYNTVAAKESERNLEESRLFTSAEVTPYAAPAEDFRNVLATIEEGKTTEFVIGVGVSTNSGVAGTISFTQRNFSWTEVPDSWSQLFRGRAFRGGGQVLRMNLEPGTEFTRARLDWREPYLFDQPVSLGAGAYYFTRGRDSYDENRLGADVSLGRLFKNRWYAEVAVRPENVYIDQIDPKVPEVLADEGEHLLVAFKGTLVRDRTDSRWLPSSGDRWVLSFEQFVGDDTFSVAGVHYTRYHTLHVDALDRKHILALRGEFDGVVTGDAPVFERFSAGGVGSIRGFEFRGISPRSTDPDFADEAIGGELMVYLGGEYSMPLAGEVLRGVVFLDSGTVERDCRGTTWRVSAGVGLRIQVPYFTVPMSLDFGFPIHKDDLDETQVFSFTFGWFF